MSDDCPDCQVAPGAPHQPGCDVERCKLCGWQAISCNCPPDTPPTTWTGQWPGLAELALYGIADLNELGRQAMRGLLTWDSDAEQWRTAPTGRGV